MTVSEEKTVNKKPDLHKAIVPEYCAGEHEDESRFRHGRYETGTTLHFTPRLHLCFSAIFENLYQCDAPLI